MKQKQLPSHICRLTDVLAKELAAQVDVEPVPGTNRYRLAVVSKKFRKMDHLDRQDRLWDIVDRLLMPKQSLTISMILAFTPQELEPTSGRKGLH